MFENRKIEWHRQKPEEGAYHCCQFFNAADKFDSKTGFPSFWRHQGDQVRQQCLSTYGRERVQLVCANCGSHLGHLFQDARTPTGVRYCINAMSVSRHEPPG